MQVANDSWQAAGAGSDAKLIVQNVGTVRIAFVIAASAPASDAYELDADEHGILNPGSEPMTVTGMDDDSTTFYVRALGPKAGALYTFPETVVV